MNPPEKEKDEAEMDSTAESKPKSAPTDQETEKPPTQSGVATSSQRSSQTSSLTTVQRISATLRGGNVPAFTRTQLRTQSGVATSSKHNQIFLTTVERIEAMLREGGNVPAFTRTQLRTQSGVATSSKPNQLLFTAVQRIAAMLRECNVPAFMTTQLPNLSKPPIRKSKPGLPPISPKKPKLTHTARKPPPNPLPNLDPDPGPNSDPDPIPNPARHFDISVSNSDRLPIAYDPAVDFFPATSPSLTEEHILLLTDPYGRVWHNITYMCFHEEEAFVLTRNWAQYAQEFNLRVMDTLRFRPGVVPNHFMLQHFPRPEIEPVQLRLPEFLPQNFLFQVELERGDVEFGRLVIGAEKVRFHCPGIKGGRKPEMVKLTDFRDKDWYVTIVHSAFVDGYMVMDGWPGLVREHELGAGDLVRFYKPDCLAHEKHFLIQFERRGPTQAQN